MLRTSEGGLPDVILAHPKRPARFVEVKTDSDVSPVQAYRHAELKRDGFSVAVISPSDWPLRAEDWQP